VRSLEVCLVRHADALDADGIRVTSDADRPLSAKGLLQAKLLGKSISAVGWQPDLILHSPLERARKTALGLADILSGPHGHSVKLHAIGQLASGFPVRPMIRVLQDLMLEGSVVLVAHMPELSDLAGWLLGADPASLPFPKAGAMLLSCPAGLSEGMGRLIWFTNPVWQELAD